MNEFEQRLRQTPVKPVPAGWRAEILAAAGAVSPAAVVPTRWEQVSARLNAWLWPHPKAWAGLAAVWAVILALNLSQREPAPVMAEKSAPPSPEMVTALRQQQQLLAELAGATEVRDADRPKAAGPQPRTQVARVLMG
jgi:hypothetical protein